MISIYTRLSEKRSNQTGVFRKQFGLFFLYLFFVCIWLNGCQQPPFIKDNDWLLYKAKFLTVEGRIVDTGNNGISHSEGQGYGMLLAANLEDRKTFEQLWQWTAKNLQTRQDYLFSWKYQPGIGVADPNNASDGDILIAWALLTAGNKWHNNEYIKHSKNILIDIRNKLIRKWGEMFILLPGEDGFSNNGQFTINLSYWVYPAFADFISIDPSPRWDQLIEAGLELQAKARFGRWNMTPDWLDLNEKIDLAAMHPPVSGYDAIRVPLYQLWNRKLTAEYAQNNLDFFRHSMLEKGYLAPVINLNNDQLVEYDAPKGIKAVYHLQQAYIDGENYQLREPIGDQDSYYSSTLCLLTKIASQVPQN